MKAPLWFLSAILLGEPASASAEAVRVLGHVVLGESKIDGEKIGEFSALVRNPDGQGLIAISDRGYLAKLDLGFSGGRLTEVTPVSVHLLTDPAGNPLRDQDFNPEAAALLDDGTLAIVSETGPRLAVFDTDGRWLRDDALPAALADATLQASRKDGIEALAWTPETGFVAITEEPQIGSTRDRHALFSTKAGSGIFSTGDSDSISIKGMDTDGRHLIILERTRDDVTEAARPWLRRIDLSTCLGSENCTSEQLDIPLENSDGADFEGLVALGESRYLMVSDDKIGGDLRSVFVLLQIVE